MTDDDHLAGLGKLMGNLQSLELCLRIFLAEEARQDWRLPAPQTKSVPETFLTNWDSLSELVNKYNRKLTAAERRLYSVDSRIVETRNALAHGRLCAPDQAAFPLTLWRFGESNESGMVSVEQIVVLSNEWLDEWRTSTQDQIVRVLACAVTRGYKSLRDRQKTIRER
jgi:hypothetical protein